jgi:hypothetical protein
MRRRALRRSYTVRRGNHSSGIVGGCALSKSVIGDTNMSIRWDVSILVVPRNRFMALTKKAKDRRSGSLFQRHMTVHWLTIGCMPQAAKPTLVVIDFPK